MSLALPQAHFSLMILVLLTSVTAQAQEAETPPPAAEIPSAPDLAPPDDVPPEPDSVQETDGVPPDEVPPTAEPPTSTVDDTAPTPSESNWTNKGELALESRLFNDDDNSVTEDASLGLFGRLEVGHDHQPFEARVRLYGRMDAFDDDRTVLVLEEGWAQVKRGMFRLRVGVDIVNWTATEAFHPADVINARNLDSDLENYEKVGEPMVALQLRPRAGTTVTAFYMPYRTAPIFTSPHSRLHFVPGIDFDDRRVMIDGDGDVTDEDFGHQGAVHLRQVLGSADTSVHAIHHMDRNQPIPVIDATGDLSLVFTTVTQVGGTYQQVFGPLVAKLEGAYRNYVDVEAQLGAPGGTSVLYEDRDHVALAVGFEYLLAHAGGSESTLLLEGQVFLGPDDEVRRWLSPFQQDVLVGYRFAFNNESSRELLLTAIGDVEDFDELLVNVSYQQRIGETWTIKGGLRVFAAEGEGFVGLQPLRDADHLRLTLTRHF